MTSRGGVKIEVEVGEDTSNKMFDRKEIIMSTIDKITEHNFDPGSDQYPAGWIGEKECLVNLKPLQLSVSFPETENDEIGDEESMPDSLYQSARTLYRSYQKLDGRGKIGFYSIYRLMGIAPTIAESELGCSSGFYSILVEALETFSSISKLLFGKQDPSILILGDSSNALTLGTLLLARAKNVDKLKWKGVSINLFYEGISRDYLNVSDVVEFVYQKRVQTCTLLEGNLVKESNRVMQELGPDATFSAILVDATGNHVLENLDNAAPSSNASFEGTKVLFLARKLINTKLMKDGSAIFRLHVLPLTNNKHARLLFEITKEFKSLKWVMPATGRDVGVVYLILEHYKGTDEFKASVSLLDTWTMFDSIPSRHVECLELLNTVLGIAVPVFTAFIESALQMMHLEEEELQKCRVELYQKRATLFQTTEARIGRLLDKNFVKRLVSIGQHNALVFNWQRKIQMPKDTTEDFTNYFGNHLKDQLGLLLNFHHAHHLGLESITEATKLLQDYHRQCSSFWDETYPKSMLLPKTSLVFSNWADLPFASHPLETVYSSRWCLSGLVSIRAVLKETLRPHFEFITGYGWYDQCGFCRAEDKTECLKRLKSVENKKPFLVITKELLHVVCLAEEFEEFVSLTDKGLCYKRLRIIMDKVMRMESEESLYLCNPSLLTRLDLGIIYLLASQFAETRLVASMKPFPTFGVLFHRVNQGCGLFAVQQHLEECIQQEKLELVDESSLNEYFSTHFLHAMNSALLTISTNIIICNAKKSRLF